MEKSNYQIALLIDGDNIESGLFGAIMGELKNFGRVVYKGVYGDFSKSKPRKWAEAAKFNGMDLRYESPVKGKNSADILMVIDAMDLLYVNKNIDCFCIATNDRDFVGLVSRLRKDGVFVIGAFEAIANDALKNNYDYQILLGENKTQKRETQNLLGENKTQKRETQNLRNGGSYGVKLNESKRQNGGNVKTAESNNNPQGNVKITEYNNLQGGVKTASGNNASGNNASGNNASVNSASGNNASGNNASGNSASGNNANGNNASGNNASGNNANVNNASGNSIGGNTEKERDAVFEASKGVYDAETVREAVRNIIATYRKDKNGYANFAGVLKKLHGQLKGLPTLKVANFEKVFDISHGDKGALIKNKS
ncbi:MAG: NYN domain-containing protein [Clostridiales bacterium]|jgi:uncharacterized protein (TIGR00288 family)|nr:NYN domain-containing protein [Clostridiales bacterium]